MSTLLTSEQIATLKNPSQRFNLYLAYTDVFTLTVNSIPAKKENGDDNPDAKYHQEMIWKTNILMGGSRLAFVNRPLYFNAGRSHCRDSGWLGGGEVTGSNATSVTYRWDMGDGTVYQGKGSDYITTGGGHRDRAFVVWHAWTTPGLYDVTLSVTLDGSWGKNAGTTTTKRWVRVVDNYADLGITLLGVDGFSSSLDRGGSEVSFRVSGDTSWLQNYMNVILWVEDLWGQWDAASQAERFTENTVCHAIGPLDPNIIFHGFVVQNSIDRTSETGVVTFSARTGEYVLEKGTLYATDFWDRYQADGKYGHWFGGALGQGGVGDLRITDVMYHLISEHTNWTERFDAGLWPHDALMTNHCGSLTFNEGTIWQGFGDFANNVYAYLSGDTGGFSIISNLQVEDAGNAEVALIFDDDLMLEPVKLDERESFKISYVVLDATTSSQSTITKRSGDPLAQGHWELRHDLLMDDANLVQKLANGVYKWRNAPYGATVRTALNHAIRPGSYVVLKTDSAVSNVYKSGPVPRLSLGSNLASMEVFVVMQADFEIDLERGLFRSTYTLEMLGSKRWDSTYLNSDGSYGRWLEV